MDINYLNIKKLFSGSSEKQQLKSNISISNIPETPKIILMIFPIHQDFFRVASYSYRNLPYDKDKIEFHYIVDSNFIESFSLRRGMLHKMKLDNKLRIINKNDLLLQLSKINFDIIIEEGHVLQNAFYVYYAAALQCFNCNCRNQLFCAFHYLFSVFISFSNLAFGEFIFFLFTLFF